MKPHGNRFRDPGRALAGPLPDPGWCIYCQLPGKIKPEVLDMPTGPDEVCDARPHAPATNRGDPEVSADILLMEQTVGQYIRDNGNPQERDLYDMLKKLKHRYTQKQIRLWKKHFGDAAAAVSVT